MHAGQRHWRHIWHSSPVKWLRKVQAGHVQLTADDDDATAALLDDDDEDDEDEEGGPPP